MKGKKIYIAGKITGFDGYKEKFAAAERMLAEMGAIPMNPAVLPEGFKHEEYMQICLAMMDVCHYVYMLDNWRDSQGAKEEHIYALDCNMGIVYQNEENMFCKWLYDEVCCNSDCDECTDFPSKELCMECKYREV